MRRLSGVVLAGAILLPAFSQNAFAQAQQPAAEQPAAGQQPAAAQQAPAQPQVQKFTMDGDVAVLSVSVNGTKTAEYEQVLAKLKEVLATSPAPEAKQQAAGWKVVRAAKPMPDGNIIYMHIINPVPGADYSVLQSIYAVVKDPAEQKALYDTYVGTGAKNLSLVTGTVAVDLSK